MGCNLAEDRKLEKSTFLWYQEGQTLDDTLNRIIVERGVTRITAIKTVYDLLSTDGYRLKDPHPPKNFFSFAFSFFNYPFWTVIFFLWLTLYSITAFTNYPLLYVRYVCTLFLTLIVPGYLIMDAVMPSGFRRETMLKIGLSIILNFLLVAVVTFMAASSSFGLTENSTVIGLLGITLIFSVIWSVSKYARRSFG